MPWPSASVSPDPYARPTLLWPSAAVVKAQDELTALGLDDGPRRPKPSSYPGIWIRNDKPDHSKSAQISVQLPVPVVLRAGADQSSFPCLGPGVEDRAAPHPAGQADAERACESFHGRLREECLRVSYFTNLFLHQPVRRTQEGCELADGIQRTTSTQQPRLPN